MSSFDTLPNSYVVHGAKVTCTCGDAQATLCIRDRGDIVGYGPRAMHVDTKPENFSGALGYCSRRQDACVLGNLKDSWDFVDDGMINNREKQLKPILIESKCICWNGGVINILTNGQRKG